MLFTKRHPTELPIFSPEDSISQSLKEYIRDQRLKLYGMASEKSVYSIFPLLAPHKSFHLFRKPLKKQFQNMINYFQINEHFLVAIV